MKTNNNSVADAANQTDNQPVDNNVEKNEKDSLEPVVPQPTNEIEFQFEDATEEDTFAIPLEEGVLVDFTHAKMQNGKRVKNGTQIGSKFPTVCAGGFRFPLKAVASIIKPKGNSRNDIETALRELGVRKLAEYTASKYGDDGKRIKPAYWRWGAIVSDAE